ncbi:hypothetical protein DSM3645_06911 [Blastopirellula marina DSM 3645]|uniref:Uncharacterized protein n=1 Tax=Blastopirellula marina DSM 3645 TaxID=314230 RepID=A3ZYC2_9BACT|nr:hypothetical protein DSM3645_06911 [Blastopirellula marina DSM 3645]
MVTLSSLHLVRNRLPALQQYAAFDGAKGDCWVRLLNSALGSRKIAR